MPSEWVEWHKGYDGGQALSRRLDAVQRLIREAIDDLPPGPIHAISMCAGDGRDLLGVLLSHPRRTDVRACLVELDPELASRGREALSREEVQGVEFRRADASTTDAYKGAVPADLVLVCGVFGNISDDDIHNTVDHLPELCAPRAIVIWTRGRFEPDLTPTVRRWFAEAGFEERAFVTFPGSTMSVGAHRLHAAARPFRPHERLFTFLPREERPSARSRANADVG
jgi:Putative methyltransferase